MPWCSVSTSDGAYFTASFSTGRWRCWTFFDDAVFVGDDPQWDVVGAQNAGRASRAPRIVGKGAGLKAIRNLEASLLLSTKRLYDRGRC